MTQLRFTLMCLMFVWLPACNKETPELPFNDQDLLTDEGLQYPIDDNAPIEKPEWVEGIKTYAHPVRSITSDKSFDDLVFLEPLLDGKRVVQLGESGHGVREFNHAKVRLIKYLHQELGYQVIAFESGIFDCYQAYQMVLEGTSNPLNTMQQSIFGVWSTSEVQALFEYIEASSQSGNPLVLTGFDVQFSSQSRLQRPSILSEMIRNTNMNYADSIFDLDSRYQEILGTDLISQQEEIRNNYENWHNPFNRLLKFLHQYELQILEDNSDLKLLDLKFMQRSIWSTLMELRQDSILDPILYTEIRDQGMAENLIYLSDSIFSNEKIMVWAHNFHIRHDQPSVETDYIPGVKTMGFWLKSHYEDELYSIGLYHFTGSGANNDRSIYYVGGHRSGSLESIMHRTQWRYAFLDFSRTPIDETTDWLIAPVINKSWGQFEQKMIHQEQYDGVFFIQETSPPRYL